MQNDTNKDFRDLIFEKYKNKITLALKVCAHCSLCAESCFLYNNKKDPSYTPSYKFINSIGKFFNLHKKKKEPDNQALEEAKNLVWEKCVLCTRCYCPFGLDIPEMITLGRSICRTYDVLPDFDKINNLKENI